MTNIATIETTAPSRRQAVTIRKIRAGTGVNTLQQPAATGDRPDQAGQPSSGVSRQIADLTQKAIMGTISPEPFWSGDVCIGSGSTATLSLPIPEVPYSRLQL